MMLPALRFLLVPSVPVLLALAWTTVARAEVAGDAAQPSAARVIRVGPHHPITRVADAARNARSGDVIEVDAGEYIDDVASIPQSHLTIRAVGGRARMVQQGASAEGKAIWVIKGDHVVVENFEFSGARAPDHNGAGIRHEGGKLTVRNCLFEWNQMGLLTWNNERAELVIERSEFRHNAAAQIYKPGDPIGHQIYVGSIGHFTLRDSYVHDGAFGHLVKSRARENHITYNRITDETGGRSSYELEFPNGGVAYVVGNIIGQSANTENADLVSYGAEGFHWPHNELYLVHNTLVDGAPAGGNFVRVKPGADRVKVVNNLLLGNGRFDLADPAESTGNLHAEPGDVASMPTGDYRLRRRSALAGKAADPGKANGVKLRPEREYVHPRQSRPLPRGPQSPGALQSMAP